MATAPCLPPGADRPGQHQHGRGRHPHRGPRMGSPGIRRRPASGTPSSPYLLSTCSVTGPPLPMWRARQQPRPESQLESRVASIPRPRAVRPCAGRVGSAAVGLGRSCQGASDRGPTGFDSSCSVLREAPGPRRVRCSREAGDRTRARRRVLTLQADTTSYWMLQRCGWSGSVGQAETLRSSERPTVTSVGVADRDRAGLGPNVRPSAWPSGATRGGGGRRPRSRRRRR